jgi:hypothetical protein
MLIKIALILLKIPGFTIITYKRIAGTKKKARG